MKYRSDFRRFFIRLASLTAAILVASLVPVISEAQVPNPEVEPAMTEVQIQSAGAVSPANGLAGWKAEYYANAKLKGKPALVRTDLRVSYNWGSGVPAPGVPADNFSVRWTSKVGFVRGTYRFCITADDGVRVELDDQTPFIRRWQDGLVTQCSEVWVSGGIHKVRVEYYEHTGQAKIDFWWEQVNWKGEYFANRRLRGEPKLVRFDPRLDFNWGTGSPARRLPADDFSVRWTRRIHFTAGTYRLCVTADDGVRVEMDDKAPFIDQWHEGGGNYCADVQVSEGLHKVRVEYYERQGQAKVSFTKDRIK
jgi:hypothetical protein